MALDTPSRLKGIETLWFRFHKLVIFDFGYAFPFEGNRNFAASSNSSNALNFGYAFPFEGNGNTYDLKGRCSTD